MLDQLSTTQILAALIGLYFVAAAVGLLSDRDNIANMFKELTTQSATGYLAGVIAFTIGAAIVAVHNDWSSLLAGFVSLIGWLALAEGVLMLACRKRFMGAFERWANSPGLIPGIAGVVLLVGAALIAAGLLA